MEVSKKIQHWHRPCTKLHLPIKFHNFRRFEVSENSHVALSVSHPISSFWSDRNLYHRGHIM